MCSLVEILSIERQPQAYSDTRSKLDIVRQSSDASVIDFGLICKLGLAVPKKR